MPKKNRRRRGVEEIRALLAQAREDGLSQRELAEQVGVHPNTVGCWVRRERANSGSALATTRQSGKASFVPVRVTESEAACRQVEDDGRIAVTLEGGFASRDVKIVLPDSVRSDDFRALFKIGRAHV